MHPQREWRETIGVSQGQLSKASAVLSYPVVDQGLISKLEQGALLPGSKTMAQLCIASVRLIAQRKMEVSDKIVELKRMRRRKDVSHAEIMADIRSASETLKRLSIAQPLRLAHYLPRDLAITYSQTMEAHHHGMARGGIEEGIHKRIDEGGGKAEGPSIVGNWKDWRARNEAGKAKNQPTRPRGGGGRGRKATKAAKAKKG